MERESKLKLAVRCFEEAGGVLRMSEALKLGIHRRILYQMRDEGLLEVLDRGLYRLKGSPEPTLSDLVPIVKKVPNGVLCLISALSYHELTTQIPHFVHVAIPANAAQIKIAYPPIKYFWYTKKLLTTGVVKEKLDSITIKVFDIEKTLVDCVKFRNKIGMDIVLEALKLYWQRGETDLDKLFEYARIFRVANILKPIMETITSG